jgi:hypothetical protein
MVKDLVEAIKWKRATQIVGNSHASLIGLVSDAWVRRGRPGEERFVLEAPPAIGEQKERIFADALFGQQDCCVGIAEVEGEHPLETLDKFDRYFDGYGQTIFGLCVIYPYFLRGCDPERKWRFINDVAYNEGVQNILDRAEHLSDSHPTNPFMLVLVEKKYHPGKWLETGQDQSEYYRGQVSGVIGYLYPNGGSPEELILFP